MPSRLSCCKSYPQSLTRTHNALFSKSGIRTTNALLFLRLIKFDKIVNHKSNAHTRKQKKCQGLICLFLYWNRVKLLLEKLHQIAFGRLFLFLRFRLQLIRNLIYKLRFTNRYFLCIESRCIIDLISEFIAQVRCCINPDHLKRKVNCWM